jgi:hypothetical protein
MSIEDCLNGANGFVNIPDDKSGTVAKRVSLGDGVTVTLEYGTVDGQQRAWAKISGPTLPDDRVWMDWTTDPGHHTWLQCGPWEVDRAHHSKTSAAKDTNPDPNWQFRACGDRRQVRPAKCTDWWGPRH